MPTPKQNSEAPVDSGECIRPATLSDLTDIVEFNLAMALETEGLRLLPEVLTAGVRAVLADASRGRYFVAESAGRLAGGLLITTEWSDWRNGHFWWIQSVYVRPEFRRQGIYQRLHQHIRGLCLADPGVCGLRLYVERHNLRAQETYQRQGMTPTAYLLFEELKPGTRFSR